MLCVILKVVLYIVRYIINCLFLDYEKKVLNDFCWKLSIMVKMVEVKFRKMYMRVGMWRE